MIVSVNDILVTLEILKRRPRKVILEACNKFFSLKDYPGTIDEKQVDDFQQAIRAYNVFSKEERRYTAISNY